MDDWRSAYVVNRAHIRRTHLAYYRTTGFWALPVYCTNADRTRSACWKIWPATNNEPHYWVMPIDRSPSMIALYLRPSGSADNAQSAIANKRIDTREIDLKLHA